MKKVTRESAIQLHILHYLKGISAYFGKTKTVGIKRGKIFFYDVYCFRGFPDLTFFYKNKLYFCEIKSATGKQSFEQMRFEQEATKAGITYILARSVDDVVKLLEGQIMENKTQSLGSEIEKIEGCLAHDIYSITCSNEYDKMDKIVKKYSSSLTSLIIKWLEQKKVIVNKVNHDIALIDTSRNQLITELIGEIK